MAITGPSEMSATRLFPLPKAPKNVVAKADHNPTTSTFPSSGFSEKPPRPSEIKGNEAVQEKIVEAAAMIAGMQPIPKRTARQVWFRVLSLIVHADTVAPRGLTHCYHSRNGTKPDHHAPPEALFQKNGVMTKAEPFGRALGPKTPSFEA
jgi:hypothetical protein